MKADPWKTDAETVRQLLLNYYHADADMVAELGLDDQRSLLDSYMRGIQQKLDKMAEEIDDESL